MATRIAKSYISTDRYVLKWRKLMKITMMFLAPIAASTNISDNIQHQKLSFTKSKTPAKRLITKLPMPNIDFERNDVVDSNGQPFSPNIINENDIFKDWKSAGTCITHTGTIGDQFPTKRKSYDDQKSLIIQDSTPPALVTPRIKENLPTVNSTTVFKLKSELYVEFPNKCPKNENYKMTPNWWLTKSTFAAGFDVKACSDQVVRRGATSTATESYRNPTGRTWDVWLGRGPCFTAEATRGSQRWQKTVTRIGSSDSTSQDRQMKDLDQEIPSFDEQYEPAMPRRGMESTANEIYGIPGGERQDRRTWSAPESDFPVLTSEPPPNCNYSPNVENTRAKSVRGGKLCQIFISCSDSFNEVNMEVGKFGGDSLNIENTYITSFPRGPWGKLPQMSIMTHQQKQQLMEREDTFYHETPRILMPTRVQCQRTVQQGEEVHLPCAGEVTVHFPDAGEVYGLAAAESIVQMFLWTWDIWIRHGYIDTSLLNALIQFKMLWAGATWEYATGE